MRTILFALALCVGGAAQAATWAEVDQLNDGLASFSNGVYRLAIEKLTPLAENGEPTAQLVVGKAFAAEDNVERDCQTAKRWFRRSAQGGNVEASFELARLYQDRTCGTPNQVAALWRYQQAYKRGWAEAATQVGEILLFSTDRQDFIQEAAEWFVRGAKGGDGMAAFRLGEIYENGWGTTKDPSAAFSWFEIAERHLPIGSDERKRALLMRDKIREQFTPVEVAKLLEQAHSRESQIWPIAKEGS